MNSRVSAAGLAAGLVLGAAGTATAATYEYDFKAASEPSGIGESAWTSFNTSDYFSGPNLIITADNGLDDGDDYVYFDAGNAGLGVCGAVHDGNAANQVTNSGSNLCNPSSDDGLTLGTEMLRFEATSDIVIESIYLNSNHDSDSILDTIWEIVVNGAAVLSFDDPFTEASLSGTGDIMLTLGFSLGDGDHFTVRGTEGANSYISGLGVTPVPLPAAGWLLLGGLGGLAAMKRRKKA